MNTRKIDRIVHKMETEKHRQTLAIFDMGVDLDPSETFVFDEVRGLPQSEPTSLAESRELLDPVDEMLARRMPDGRIMVLVRLWPNEFPEVLYGTSVLLECEKSV